MVTGLRNYIEAIEDILHFNCVKFQVMTVMLKYIVDGVKSHFLYNKYNK